MTLEEERDHWKETATHAVKMWDNFLIDSFKLTKICKELFLRYSDHMKGCDFTDEYKNCTCGYHDIMRQFNDINSK